MITVFGASGQLGSRIVRRLRAAGHAVRAVARRRDRLQALVEVGASIVCADLRFPATLIPACAGSSVVVTTANAIASRERGNDLRAVDISGNRALIEAARAARVRRLVFVSARGVRTTDPVDFFRAKALTEVSLKASGLNWVIVGCAPFMEIWAALYGDPVLAGGPVTLYGRGDNPIPFVSRDDVARITAELAAGSSTLDEVVEVGGPENLTAEQVVEAFERLAGKKVRRRHLSRWLMRMMSALAGPVNPVLSRLIAVSLWSDTADLRFDAGPLEARFGRLLRLEEFARQHAAAHRAPAP
jgi:uncharacterized protein YbjT (DUF2867 family)